MIETVSYTLPTTGERVLLTPAAARQYAPLLTAGFSLETAPTHPGTFERTYCLPSERTAELARIARVEAQRPPALLVQLRLYARANPDSAVAREVLPEIEASRKAAQQKQVERERTERAAAERERVALRAAERAALANVQGRLSRLEARRHSAAEARQARARLHRTAAQALRAGGFASDAQAVAAYLNDKTVRTV